jgi:hypothetical protein
MSLFFRLFKRAKKFSVDLMFWSVELREINSTPQSSYLCFSRSNDVLFDRSDHFRLALIFIGALNDPGEFRNMIQGR